MSAQAQTAPAVVSPFGEPRNAAVPGTASGMGMVWRTHLGALCWLPFAPESVPDSHQMRDQEAGHRTQPVGSVA